MGANKPYFLESGSSQHESPRTSWDLTLCPAEKIPLPTPAWWYTRRYDGVSCRWYIYDSCKCHNPASKSNLWLLTLHSVKLYRKCCSEIQNTPHTTLKGRERQPSAVSYGLSYFLLLPDSWRRESTDSSYWCWWTCICAQNYFFSRGWYGNKKKLGNLKSQW